MQMVILETLKYSELNENTFLYREIVHEKEYIRVTIGIFILDA